MSRMTLPNYPLPKLDNTLNEVNRVLKLVLTSEQFSEYTANISHAMPDLIEQNQLFEAQTKTSSNWATDGFKSQLLSLRHPIPMSTALPLLMATSRHTNQWQLSAAILWSVGHILPNLDEHISQAQDNVPLEQKQQAEIFAASRIPAKDRDSLQVFNHCRHVIVLYNSSAFVVTILNDQGQVMPVQHIYSDLMAIANYAGQFCPDICNYTAYDRITWSELYESLNKSCSQKSLELMEQAIICISLENCEIPNDYQKTMELIRFGNKQNSSCQRFYDKILNLVAFENGRFGMVFEHTAVDGMIITLLAKMIYEVCEQIDIDQKQTIERAVNIINFEAELTPIERPLLENNNIMSTFDYRTYPDILTTLRDQRMYFTWICFALQMALHKTFPSEPFLMVTPTHVRHFQVGRSDPTYPITESSQKLVEMMCNNRDENSLLRQFIDAFEEQKQLIKNTKYGRGVGPHVGHIRNILAQKNKQLEQVLNMFKTPSVYLTGHDLLEEVEGGMGNTYAPDQLVVSYLGRTDRVDICLAATGLFITNLDQLRVNFQKSLHSMLSLAAKVAIAQQMNAIHAITAPIQGSHEMCDKRYAMIIHGGAGENVQLIPEVNDMVRFALKTALIVGVKVLDSGNSSCDAVEASVMALEDCFIFNAGKGAVFNQVGKHELDASIMDGRTQMSGSVACVTTVKNPVKAARLIMDKYGHALMSGTTADKLCVENNLTIVPNNYFDTDLRLKDLSRVKAMPSMSSTKHPQTVGAVALDTRGNLATASSTGGLINKSPGRIGDTAIIGAGLYADEHVAIACTGDGDAFIRKSIASKFVTMVKMSDCSLEAACSNIFDNDMTNTFGGLIAIDSEGNAVQRSNSGLMFVASYSDGQYHINENRLITKSDYILYENDAITAYLSKSPCTPGVTIIESNSSSVFDIFALSVREFVDLMSDVRKVSKVLCGALGVQRCALITEPRIGKKTVIKLIPLHGIGDQWKPCISQDTEFHATYPGYCSSKNGPRLPDDELCLMQSKIKQACNSCEEKFHFYGDYPDDNLFARIIKGEEKAQWRVWEDNDHVAFLTPFPNTPGFTVIAPRSHLNSDVFAIDERNYIQLMTATHMVSQLLINGTGAMSCAMIFEGYEIDYTHVKLIPIFASPSLSNGKIVPIAFHSKYPGYVSTIDGPVANTDELNKVYHQVTSISAPASWKIPEKHSTVAIQHPWYSMVFQLQNTLYHATVDYFNKLHRYAFVMTPSTTDTISSPMGLGSDSEPVQIELLGQSVYLADSMQFALEYFLRLQDGLPGTYYVAQSFRGEDTDNTHLNQFYHVECELLGDMDAGIKIAEQYLYYITKQLLTKHRKLILRSTGTVAHIEKMLQMFEISRSFPRITFEQAKVILRDSNCFELIDESNPAFGLKITRIGETALINLYDSPVWLTDMDHIAVPFYQAYVPGTNKAKAADLLIGMGETIGLGERHSTAKQVKSALAQHQIPEKSYKWYINMRTVKSLLTTGWGMGTERYLCWLLNHNDVRDLQIIPRMKNMTFMP